MRMRNLWATQELLPGSGTQTWDHVAGTKLVNGTWVRSKGNAYDALDRVAKRFYYARTVQGQGQTLEAERFGYDTNLGSGTCSTNYPGLQTWEKNALGQYQCWDDNPAGMVVDTNYGSPIAENPGYAAAEGRSYGYDPDRRVLSIAENGALGKQTFAYDADGNLTSTQEPKNISDPATLTYVYYPDGLRKSRGVKSTALDQNQTDDAPLFAYACEDTGKPKMQRIQYDNAVSRWAVLSFKGRRARRPYRYGCLG